MNRLKKWILDWIFSYDYDVVLMNDAKMPYRAYNNDAGYDLYVYRSTKIPKHQMVNVSTGVFCKSKRSSWLFLTGRSSTLLKYGLLVDIGIIDGDYTGELFVKVYNPSSQDVYLYPEMRIAQLIIIPHTTGKFKVVDKLEIKRGERGEKGFGSTGC